MERKNGRKKGRKEIKRKESKEKDHVSHVKALVAVVFSQRSKVSPVRTALGPASDQVDQPTF